MCMIHIGEIKTINNHAVRLKDILQDQIIQTLFQTITIKVKGDRKREPNETLFVEFFNAVNASMADPVATGTILNDD